MTDQSKQLLERLRRFIGLFSRYQHQRHHGPGTDPHRGQGRVLTLLKMQPEISQKELAYLLDLRSQSLGELLSKLEKKGYITREPSEADRRALLVRLTEAGRAAAEQTADAETPHWLDCLEAEEQTQLAAYLERLSESLERELAESGAPEAGEWPPFPGPGEFNPEQMREFGRGFSMDMERGGLGRGFGPRHAHDHRHKHNHNKAAQAGGGQAESGYCDNPCGKYEQAPDAEEGYCANYGGCRWHQK